MDNEKSIRAFLAVEPPAEIRKEIGNIQDKLRGSCPFDVRWVKPAAIHLTLKFFGNVSPDDIAVISSIVGKNTPALAPLQFEVKRLGLFPSLKRPRVLWIGLEGDTAPLLILQKSLEQEFEEYGFRREERPFRPHLTIGRIKSSRLSGDAEKFMARGDKWEAGNFRADGLGLFQSDLTPQGAIYTRLGWFPFHQQ